MQQGFYSGLRRGLEKSARVPQVMYSIFDDNGNGLTGKVWAAPGPYQAEIRAIHDAEGIPCHSGIICQQHDEHEQGKCVHCETAARKADSQGIA